MDNSGDFVAKPVAGPSGLQNKKGKTRRTRIDSSSSSSEGSSSSSTSNTSVMSPHNKNHHRRSANKKRGGKQNRKEDLLHKLFNEVSELRKQFHNSGANANRASSNCCDDEISLLDCNSLYDCEENDNQLNDSQEFKFNFQVKLKEPSTPKTPDKYLKMLNDIQHFDKKEWCEVRYSDVQKNYNYSPGFTDLEVNEEVKSYDAQRHLAYADKAYAALTFCLLKQREALQSSMIDLVSWARAAGNVTPDQLQEKIGELFSKGEYHNVSTDMLQLICGHRAETLQMRRDGVIHSVRDPLVKSALRRIPPSNSFIFNSELLTSALEKAGGVKKAFLPSHQISSYKFASQATTNKATRFPSQGIANLIGPSQGASQTCCDDLHTNKTMHGCGHNHRIQYFGQNRPSQGIGNIHCSVHGSNQNTRGTFVRPRGGKEQCGTRQHVSNYRKRPGTHEQNTSVKRGKY